MIEIFYYLDILLLFLTFLYFMAVAFFIYLSNRSGLSNRVFSFAVAWLSLWMFSILLVMLNPNPDWMFPLYRFSAVPGFFAVAYVFYFALVYPQEKDITRLEKVLILGMPVVFGAITLFTKQVFEGFMILDIQHIHTGLRVFGPLYTYYVIGLMFYLVGAAVVTAYKMFKLAGLERKRMTFVAFAFLLGVLSGVLFSFIIPRQALMRYFSLGPFSAAVGITVVSYAMIRYKLFAMSPGVAVREILDSLGRSVVVYDLDGRAVYSRKDSYVLDEEEKARIIDDVVAHGHVSGYRTMIGKAPVNIMANFVREGGAIVMVFHDITDVCKEEGELKAVHLQMEKRLLMEKGVREMLDNLLEESDPNAIDKLLGAARDILVGYPRAIEGLERMASILQERARLLAEAKKNREALKERERQIEGLKNEIEQKRAAGKELRAGIARLKNEKGVT